MKSNSLQTKLLYINITFVLCITTLGFIAFIYYYSYAEKQSNKATAEYELSSLCISIDKSIMVADNATIQIAFNPSVQSAFTDVYFEKDPSNYFSDSPNAKDDLYDCMLPYLIDMDFINRICIYNEFGDFIATGQDTTLANVSSYLSAEHFDELDELLDNRSYIITYSKEDLLFTNKLGVSDSYGYLSIIRPVYNTQIKNQPLIGYIEVQLPVENLLNDFSYLYETANLQVFLEDLKIASTGVDISQSNIVIAQNLDDYNEFRFQISKSFNLNHDLFLGTITIIIFILIILAIILLAIQKTVISRVTAPLIDLCQSIELDNEVFLEKQVALELNSNNLQEVSTLYHAFYEMLHRLNQSANDLSAANSKQLEAQMLALQAHINPHFIHNNLTIISSLAIEDNTAKIKKVVKKLSFMIRYTADYSQKNVVLANELEHISAYLELLKEKYENDFTYIIDAPANASHVAVPKFILQPLVENALTHSLKQADFPWFISVSCIVSDTDWKISISDSGIGIDEIRINELLDKYHAISISNIHNLIDSLQIGGYSLLNSLTRLYIMYKDDMIFDIYKNTKGGTTVEIGATTIKGGDTYV